MKFVCLYGSPRRYGNSATIARAFLETAKHQGAVVESFYLYSLKYAGCNACMACKTLNGACVKKDDLSRVLEAVREGDVLVLAAPIYYGDVSAAMRAFVERSHSYLGPNYGPLPGDSRLEPGKKLVLVIAQGHAACKHGEVYLKYKKYFGWYGFNQSFLLQACEVIEPGEIKEKQPEILEQARLLAEELCGQGGNR